jgi:hypothetical protein
MYHFERIPKCEKPFFVENYKNGKMKECFDILNKYQVNDNCNSCNNLYELKQWIEWALKKGIL